MIRNKPGEKMKYTTRKSMTIDFTLDSSEAIMFTKNGKHSVILEGDAKHALNEDRYWDKIEISFQIAKEGQERFDHITSEATKHRAQWDEINKREEKK
jgi:hypothetical protein